MSRIVSPNPVLLTIEYHEAMGAARFNMSREIPLLSLLSIFGQVQTSLISSNPAAKDKIFTTLAVLADIQLQLINLLQAPAPTPGTNAALNPGTNGTKTNPAS